MTDPALRKRRERKSDKSLTGKERKKKLVSNKPDSSRNLALDGRK